MGEQYHNIPDGEFRVVLNAKKIQKDAFRIISSEKLVPKRMRWLGADMVAQTAKQFKYEVKLANNLNSKTQAEERKQHQLMAVALLKTLSELMDDLCDDVGFSHDRIKQWQKDVNTELFLLSKWISKG